MSNLQEASDLENNISISARRFEESPFIERTDCPEMIRGVYAGRYFPIFIGENYLDKYWCLRQKALIFDVPEKPVEISGPDAVSFLEKIVARKVATMKEGRGYYAIACTPHGGVFMDGVMFRMGENRFWYVQADGPFEAWLLAHSGSFDVTISDPHSRVLQIQGPASFDIMNAASGGAIDETMQYFRSGFFELGGQRLYVSRTGFTNELGFEIYTDGANTDHIALWDHLMACGEPYGMEFSSTRALTIRRIEGGILGNGTDITPDMTPFEAGLAPFINMDKGDFIGRDALVGKDTRSCLFGLTCASETPAAGSIVLDGDAEVGHITAGIPSPIRLEYKVQPSPDGLAQAFILADDFLEGTPSAMVLGDNIFFGHGLPQVLAAAGAQETGATVFGYHVSDPERYGVVDFDADGRVKTIIEKPTVPPSNYAVTGLYFVDGSAPERAKQVTRSARGELEITSLLESYLSDGALRVEKMGRGYAWLDTGTHASLLDASNFVRTLTERQGLQVGSPDEVAYELKWISKDRLGQRAELFGKNKYGQYLLGLCR